MLVTNNNEGRQWYIKHISCDVQCPDIRHLGFGRRTQLLTVSAVSSSTCGVETGNAGHKKQHHGHQDHRGRQRSSQHQPAPPPLHLLPVRIHKTWQPPPHPHPRG